MKLEFISVLPVHGDILYVYYLRYNIIIPDRKKNNKFNLACNI